MTQFRLPVFLCFVAAVVVGVIGTTGIAQETEKAGTMKVVFLGDSITQAGAGPTGYVTLVKEALKQRHPDKPIEVIGAGISGHKVPDLQARLQRDVLVHKPNLVVIYIGINDVWHSQSNNGTPKDKYESGLKDIISQIHGVGSRVILCTPTMIGEKTDGSNSLDAMLEEYSEISRNVAKETSVTLLDLRKKMVRELQILNADQAGKGVLTSDGVHLNDAGNEFLKDCMLPTVESVLSGTVLKHVVMFKFKPDTKQADINRVSDGFVELAANVDTVVDFDFGEDNSFEGLNQGYTHCYIVTFKNAADRDAYLPHPAHLEFVKMLAPFIDGALVNDFWAQD